MRRATVLILMAGMMAMAPAGFAADPDWRTRPPITYVLDYGQGHLDSPEYIAAVAASPPTLLHLGKDVVMSHNWGPIAGVGGENQAGGKGDAIRRLTPAETRERFRRLEEMVDGLHAAGVRWVMPYICSITLGGSHIRRTGFWEFYDHWDEYLEFGLPPRPELDPADWMQRNPDGSMKSTYGVRPDVDEFYPPYEPNMRYAACVNNPGWRTWIDAVARLVAAVGYDGAFIDNGGTQQCYCRFCQAKYQDWLRERYVDEEIPLLFGVGAGEQVPLAVKPAAGEPMTLGWVESQRFWRHSIHEHQQAIRRAGEEVGGGFILFPNGGHGRPESVRNAFMDSNYIMYELSIGDYGTHPGLIRSRIVDDISMTVRNDHVWQLKYTLAVRELVSPLLLTRGGYPSEEPGWVLNQETAALGNAEAAAFGSGAGFLLRPRWNEYADVLNCYRAFFEGHEDLFAGYVPYAQVGIAAFGDQNFYENRKHVTSVEQVTAELLDAHVLFDYITEDRFTPKVLAAYPAVVFADVRYASREQIDALDGYVRAGGRALIIGETPTHDLRVQPLDPQRLPAALRPTPEGAELHENMPYGEGTWLRYSRIPLDEVAGLLSRRAGELDIAPDAGPGVRVNAFIDPDGDAMVLHLLNYDTPLGAEPEPLEDKTNLELSVPLPQGAAVVAATAFAPDADGPEALAHDTRDGRAHIMVPSLHIYKVLRIELG